MDSFFTRAKCPNRESVCAKTYNELTGKDGAPIVPKLNVTIAVELTLALHRKQAAVAARMLASSCASQEGLRYRMSARDGVREQKSSLIRVPDFDWK